MKEKMRKNLACLAMALVSSGVFVSFIFVCISCTACISWHQAMFPFVSSLGVQ